MAIFVPVTEVSGTVMKMKVSTLVNVLGTDRFPPSRSISQRTRLQPNEDRGQKGLQEMFVLEAGTLACK